MSDKLESSIQRDHEVIPKDSKKVSKKKYNIKKMTKKFSKDRKEITRAIDAMTETIVKVMTDRKKKNKIIVAEPAPLVEDKPKASFNGGKSYSSAGGHINLF